MAYIKETYAPVYEDNLNRGKPVFSEAFLNKIGALLGTDASGTDFQSLLRLLPRISEAKGWRDYSVTDEGEPNVWEVGKTLLEYWMHAHTEQEGMEMVEAYLSPLI